MINNLDKSIAQKILQIKSDLAISTEEIATELGVESSFIRMVESGKKKYNILHIYLILHLFNNKIEKHFSDTIKKKSMDDFFPAYSEEFIKVIKLQDEERKNQKLSKNTGGQND